ncbi:MAG: DUF4373 domain-containing protein [Sphingobacteriales bacterium]|nr:MAG: DUF4373 domain-containing protein [Sphingobacteriales bacterium]
MPRAKILRHSSDARHNEKIAALVGDHGPAGYGAYWMILEIMHREQDMRIEHSKARIRRLAGQVGMAADVFAQLLDDMIEIYELLAVEDGYLTSTLSYTRRAKPQKSEANEDPAIGEVPVAQIAQDEEIKAYIRRGYNDGEIKTHHWLKQVVEQRAPDVWRSLCPLAIDQSLYIYNNYKEQSVFTALDRLQANATLRNRTTTVYDAVRRVLDK